MKNLFIILSLLALTACKTSLKADESAQVTLGIIAPISDSVIESASIYEVNLRQYSPEGTINAFTKDIPQLKQLGVDILWVMPFYPISVKDRKGTLGSYYAIQDYTKVNSNFGTLDDFKKLVKTAHDNGLYVIIDWVPNHTGRDHVWLSAHPDFYVRDSTGKPLAPFDWTDVAKLDYSNPAMRKAMISAMSYWLKNADVDGFRCDVAGEVPTDFWDEATTQLKQIKPIFMLAEAEKAELMHKAFDMQYGWEAHHIFNSPAQGKDQVKAWDAYIIKQDSLLEKDDILMNFTSNHDENSWNGTVFERMGAAAKTMAALSFATKGMPLIYNGQEYDMNKRLRFFEKDTIPQTKGVFYDFYTQLNGLKATYKALDGGKNAGNYTRLPTSNDASILAFERSKESDSITFIANLTGKKLSFKTNLTGNYTDVLTKTPLALQNSKALTFEPWEFHFLVKK